MGKLNEGRPVPWRVDGQLGIAPRCSIVGAWYFCREQIPSNRCRGIAFGKAIDTADLEALFYDFAETG